MEGGEQTKKPTTNEQDLLNQFMPGEMQEEMMCFTMGDCELHKLMPRHDRQSKECEFMRTSIHLTTMAITDDESGTSYTIPIVVIDNDDYDEDQDQTPQEKLPITENLIFMRYSTDASDEESAKIGYVFYYPELNDCKIIESEPGKSDT